MIPSLSPSRVTLCPQNSLEVLSVTLPANLFFRLEETQHELKCKGVPEEMKTMDQNSLKCLPLPRPPRRSYETRGRGDSHLGDSHCRVPQRRLAPRRAAFLSPKKRHLHRTFSPKRLNPGLRIKFIFRSQSFSVQAVCSPRLRQSVNHRCRLYGRKASRGPPETEPAAEPVCLGCQCFPLIELSESQ